MNVTMPALVRPTVGTLRLRNGEQAIAISAGGQRVLVRHAHAETLIDDIEDALDQIGDQ